MPAYRASVPKREEVEDFLNQLTEEQGNLASPDVPMPGVPKTPHKEA